MRKLVLKDSDGWLAEVDPKALRREALALKAYIEQAPRREEKQFRYRERLLPLVEAALNGTLKIPYKGQDPYSPRMAFEGLEPMLLQPFSSELYSPFFLRICGYASLSAPSYLRTHDLKDYVPDIVEKNGERYEWVEFED